MIKQYVGVGWEEATESEVPISIAIDMSQVTLIHSGVGDQKKECTIIEGHGFSRIMVDEEFEVVLKDWNDARNPKIEWMGNP